MVLGYYFCATHGYRKLTYLRMNGIVPGQPLKPAVPLSFRGTFFQCPQFPLCFGISRPQPQRLPYFADRFVELSRFGQRHAEAQVGRSIGAVELDRAPEFP